MCLERPGPEETTADRTTTTRRASGHRTTTVETMIRGAIFLRPPMSQMTSQDRSRFGYNSTVTEICKPTSTATASSTQETTQRCSSSSEATTPAAAIPATETTAATTPTTAVATTAEMTVTTVVVGVETTTTAQTTPPKAGPTWHQSPAAESSMSQAQRATTQTMGCPRLRRCGLFQEA